MPPTPPSRIPSHPSRTAHPSAAPPHLKEIRRSARIKEAMCKMCLTKMCLTPRGRQVLRDVAIRRVPLALRKQLQADVKPRAAPAAAPARRATFRSNLRAREAPPADAEETALVAEELGLMEERARLARELVSDLAAGETDLAALRERVRAARAAGDRAAWSALGRAALRLVEDMEARAKEFHATAAALHAGANALIQRLPRDYRVVWKPAVCQEINAKVTRPPPPPSIPY